MGKAQVKSKERVAEHGEVFTNEREVNAMCDLVANECDRIDSRVLEPACGDGNFLAEIIRRKLATVTKLYKKNTYDWERYSVLAMTSIYGVDIMQDNVDACRARMFEIWNAEYESVCKNACVNETREAVIYILSKNILCGNALTLKCVDENQNDKDEPIIFAEWSMIASTKLKRRDFRLDVLLRANESDNKKKNIKGQNSLFADETEQYLTHNPEKPDEYMALPIKEYAPVHYRRVINYE